MEQTGKIWFSSDWHLGHKNIAGPEVSNWKEGYRNFTSVAEMDETIIRNVNAVVKQDDTLFYLGDFFFGEKSKMKSVRDRIVCQNIIFVKGNHDKTKEIKQVFGHCHDYWEGDIAGIKFVLLHYAMRLWNKSHHGSIHLYGHSHSKLEAEPWGLSMDVGIDNHPEFRPFSLEEVLKIMEKREAKLIDHHGRGKNKKGEDRL